MAQVLSGKEISAKIKARVADETQELSRQGIVPGLAVVIVGDDPASRVYVNNKKKLCGEMGFYSEEHALAADTSTDTLLALVRELNARKDVHGILVQLPLPKQIDEKAVIAAIHPDKDVDAFHPVNVGKIMLGNYTFAPCTPAGVMAMIAETGIDLTGKDCVVIGRSNIVGKPMAMLLMHANATVTICHSKTRDLAAVCRRGDVLVAAVGRAGFVTADMVKPGAVVIDVGMNRNEAGKLCGDVAYAEVEPVAGAITPVPGGVGLMTTAMLMQNTLTAAKLQNGLL